MEEKLTIKDLCELYEKKYRTKRDLNPLKDYLGEIIVDNSLVDILSKDDWKSFLIAEECFEIRHFDADRIDDSFDIFFGRIKEHDGLLRSGKTFAYITPCLVPFVNDEVIAFYRYYTSDNADNLLTLLYLSSSNHWVSCGCMLRKQILKFIDDEITKLNAESYEKARTTYNSFVEEAKEYYKDTIELRNCINTRYRSYESAHGKELEEREGIILDVLNAIYNDVNDIVFDRTFRAQTFSKKAKWYKQIQRKTWLISLLTKNADKKNEFDQEMSFKKDTPKKKETPLEEATRYLAELREEQEREALKEKYANYSGY